VKSYALIEKSWLSRLKRTSKNAVIRFWSVTY